MISITRFPLNHKNQHSLIDFLRKEKSRTKENELFFNHCFSFGEASHQKFIYEEIDNKTLVHIVIHS